jgi:hypothetical protein
VRFAKFPRYILLAIALASGRPVAAQEIATAPETAISQTTAAPPEETTTAPTAAESNVSTAQPVFDTSPADGSQIAGGSPGTFELSDIANLPFVRFLRLSGSLIEGYDDNINPRAQTESSSWYTSANLALAYLRNDQRTHLSLNVSTGLTYYWNDPRDRGAEPNLSLRALFLYKLTERLTLTLSALAAYQSQPDFSTEFSPDRARGNYFRSMDNIDLHYALTPRLSSITHYSLALIQYEGAAAERRNRIQQSIGEGLRLLVWPTTSADADYRVSYTEFQSGSRDSISQIFSLGVNQTFAKGLKVSAHAGVQYRSSERSDRTSPYFDASIRYVLGARSSISWDNRYSIEESDQPSVAGRTSFRTSLQARYQITSRISAALLLSYLHGNNEGALGRSSSSNEDTLDISPTLRYAFDPRLSFELGYNFSEVDRGDNPGVGQNARLGSYSRNRYFGGVIFKF